MKEDIEKLQAELQNLQPAALDPALLDRFEMAIKDELGDLHPELKVTERLLEGQKAAGLPAEFADELVASVRNTPFPLDQKVVLFPGESNGLSTRKPRKPRKSWMAAAACVALAGGLAAMFVNPKDGGPSMVSSEGDGPAVVTRDAADRGAFVPASFNSGVSDTSDLGVVWPERSRPMRVVQVVYRDQVKLFNEQGEEVVVEIPRVEYLMVPEKID